MTDEDNYLAPRRCLHEPLPEHDVAADLLSNAVDAILRKDLTQAQEMVRRADLHVLFDHTTLVKGRKDKRIQRKRKVEMPALQVSKIAIRMPSENGKMALFARDLWRCRFCDCRVVPPAVRSAMRAFLPDAIPWSENEGYHGGFFAMSASVDHVVPHSAGGSNEDENLVTACWACQFGRGAYSLAELGLLDPRERPPVNDGWDGLMRLLLAARPARAAKAITPERAKFALKSEEVPPRRPTPSRLAVLEWIVALESHLQEPLRRIVAAVEACADLNMSCSVNKVLIVRLDVGDTAVNVFGIPSHGGVEIPWSIECEKMALRPFTEMLSAVIPGAIVYETAKLWCVSMPGKRRVTVEELLQAENDLRSIFMRLRSDVLNSQTQFVEILPPCAP